MPASRNLGKCEVCIRLVHSMARGALELGEPLGSGDGERKASMTREMPYEPLPASFLFALVRSHYVFRGSVFWASRPQSPSRVHWRSPT